MLVNEREAFLKPRRADSRSQTLLLGNPYRQLAKPPEEQTPNTPSIASWKLTQTPDYDKIPYIKSLHPSTHSSNPQIPIPQNLAFLSNPYSNTVPTMTTPTPEKDDVIIRPANPSEEGVLVYLPAGCRAVVEYPAPVLYLAVRAGKTVDETEWFQVWKGELSALFGDVFTDAG